VPSDSVAEYPFHSLGTGKSQEGSAPESPVALVEMQSGIGFDGDLGSFHIQS
jgi:hypothetical protein